MKGQQRQQHEAQTSARREVRRALRGGGLTHAQRTPQPESADSPAAGGSGPAASRPWPGGPGLGGPGPVVVSTHSTTPCRRANQRQDQSEHGQPEEQGSEGRASDPRLRSLSLGLTPLDLLPETIKEWF